VSNTIAVAAVFEARQMRRGIDQINGQLSGFERNAGRVSSTLKRAFAGAVVAAGIKSVVTAASDAQQSLGATQTVFAEYAADVVKDSKRAAREVGLSSNTYRENANLIGSLFKNQGIDTDQLAGKTKAMIKTASDLAATFGGTTTSAVEALSSAFKGEFDPLERYGISLKQSTVNAEAMRVANVKSTKAFDALSTAQQTSAKQQAATNLIMKQSKDSTGAFARESGTLAHQQQVLSAQVDNLKVAVGTRLLPVLTKGAAYVNDEVLPALADFREHAAEVRDAIDSEEASCHPRRHARCNALAEYGHSVCRHDVHHPPRPGLLEHCRSRDAGQRENDRREGRSPGRWRCPDHIGQQWAGRIGWPREGRDRRRVDRRRLRHGRSVWGRGWSWRGLAGCRYQVRGVGPPPAGLP
jgi:LysM repeat protein